MSRWETFISNTVDSLKILLHWPSSITCVDLDNVTSSPMMLSLGWISFSLSLLFIPSCWSTHSNFSANQIWRKRPNYLIQAENNKPSKHYKNPVFHFSLTCPKLCDRSQNCCENCKHNIIFLLIKLQKEFVEAIVDATCRMADETSKVLLCNLEACFGNSLR